MKEEEEEEKEEEEEEEEEEAEEEEEKMACEAEFSFSSLGPIDCPRGKRAQVPF